MARAGAIVRAVSQHANPARADWAARVAVGRVPTVNRKISANSQGSKSNAFDPSGSYDNRSPSLLALSIGEFDRNRAALLGSDHDAVCKLVVPPLFPAVKANPDQPKPKRNHRYKIRQVSPDTLTDRKRRARVRIHNAKRQSHLPRRGLLLRPKPDRANSGQCPGNNKIRRARNQALRMKIFPAIKIDVKSIMVNPQYVINM